MTGSYLLEIKGCGHVLQVRNGEIHVARMVDGTEGVLRCGSQRSTLTMTKGGGEREVRCTDIPTIEVQAAVISYIKLSSTILDRGTPIPVEMP